MTTIVKLTKEQLEAKAQFIDEYMKANNAADGSSVDANANVSNKNISTLMAELHKDFNIQIKRFLVSRKIEAMFGEELAKEYNRQIESHEIYANDESGLAPYCVSITLYPFLLNGLKDLGGESSAPKHLASFCGSFINLVFAVSSQFMGAVAVPEALMYFDYMATKDFGEDYLEKYPDLIKNCFQQIIYSINQPAAARGYQSVFFNMSIFDKPYFEAIFGDFRFPDGSAPNYKTLAKLQAFFMDWFNEERRKALLTFPVMTSAMLTDGKKPVDEEFLDMCAEQDSKGNSFFKYMSDSADSLASCCFSKDQKVLARYKDKIYFESFDTLGKNKDGIRRRQFSIFHNGNWVNGKLVELPNRPMYKITTSNNKIFVVSDNHLNPTLRGDIATKDLTTDDYLMFNTNRLDAIPEQDLHLTYEQGYLIGAFLGDGSFGRRTKYGIYELDLSLNKNKIKKGLEILKKGIKECGATNDVKIYEKDDENLVMCRLSSLKVCKFIQEWTNWVEGTKSYNKTLNMKCLMQSWDFRKGILDGWQMTDGGGANRCYTTSEDLADCMEAMITSLGYNSSRAVDDRVNKVAFIENGKEYFKNFKILTVKWYAPSNKRNMKGLYIFKNNSQYFKIKKIESVTYNDNIYCFEMENQDEPYFTLPQGLITHNCRLRNELQENTFSYSLGAGGVATGSLNVLTLNANRFIQNCVKAGKDIFEELKLQIQKMHKYQMATKEYFRDYLKANMLPVYNAGYITMEKQFLTIGINGLLEGAEFLGYKPGNNEEYKAFTSKFLKVMYDENKADRTRYKDTFWYTFNINDTEYYWFDETPVKVFDKVSNKEVIVLAKEVMHNLEKYSREGIDFTNITINKEKYKPSLKNVEFIPGESVGVKNYKWDKKDGYVVNPKRNCYNSYLYPVEDENIDIVDKFIIHGKENLQYLDGGSALHLNLEEYPNKEGYKKLYYLAAETGCNYWTTNIKVTCCEDCGNIDKRTLKACPKCGSKNITYATRIIGYLKKVSSFSSERQKEEDMRYYHKV